MKEQDKVAFKLSIGVLLLSLFSLWICKAYLKIEITDLASLIIFVPLIAFLVFSGKLKSFKYGQLEATISTNIAEIKAHSFAPIEIHLRDIVNQKGPYYKYDQTLYSTHAIIFVVGENEFSKADLFQDKDLTVPNNLRYRLHDILRYQDRRYRDDGIIPNILFVNSDQKYLGYSHIWGLWDFLEGDFNIRDFLYFLNSGELSFPLINQEGQTTLTEEITSLEALQIMNQRNLDYAVVIGKNSIFKYVLSRKQLTSHLLELLVTELNDLKIQKEK